ncbi:MAG: phosphotransferase [Planctomycetia bacterium]|nr:phosphotransferase [Planctomycetia bacterium]
MADAVPRLSWAEAAWERAPTGPWPDAAEVRRRLARWSRLAAAPHVALAGGLRACTVRVGDVVARLAVAPDHDLGKEAAAHARLAGLVRVPRVLDLDAEARVMLLEFVAHEPLPATAEAGAAVGRVAAALHGLGFPTWGFFAPGTPSGTAPATLRPEPTHPTALEALLAWADGALGGAAGARLGPRLAAAVRRAWDDGHAALARACASAAFVHGDFKPANLKWLPATREVLVLDLEFAWAGPALMDVGQLLRWEVPAAFVDAFAAAYVAGGGGLPDGWRRTADLLDLFNVVGLLDHPGDLPVRDADLLARARRTTGLASPAGGR